MSPIFKKMTSYKARFKVVIAINAGKLILITKLIQNL